MKGNEMTASERSPIIVSLQTRNHDSPHIAFGVLVGSQRAFFPLPLDSLDQLELEVLITRPVESAAVERIRPHHVEVASIQPPNTEHAAASAAATRAIFVHLERPSTLFGLDEPKMSKEARIELKTAAIESLRQTRDIMSTLAAFGFTPHIDETVLPRLSAAVQSARSNHPSIAASAMPDASPRAPMTIRDVGEQSPENVTNCYFSDECTVPPGIEIPAEIILE